MGTATASGDSSVPANGTPSGVEAASGLGTPSAAGDSVGIPAGQILSSAVGDPGATGTAAALPSGQEAGAQVGDPTALIQNPDATAQPQGVEARGEVGQAAGPAAETGWAKLLPLYGYDDQARPAGVAAVSGVGVCQAGGATSILGQATAGGVEASAQVGEVTTEAVRNVAPLLVGVGAVAAVGSPAVGAYASASCMGVGALAEVGVPQALGGAAPPPDDDEELLLALLMLMEEAA